jgi:hypothetical protein
MVANAIFDGKQDRWSCNYNHGSVETGLLIAVSGINDYLLCRQPVAACLLPRYSCFGSSDRDGGHFSLLARRWSTSFLLSLLANCIRLSLS